MWLERFVIVVTSLHRDYLPSSWGMYSPTVLGLGDVHRHHRAVLLPAVPVHPLPADDLDLRNADAVAGGGGDEDSRGTRPGAARQEAHMTTDRCTACWPSSTTRPTWSTRRARRAQAGYRRWTPIRRSRSRGWRRRSASGRRSVPLLVLLGGLVGCVGGFFMQYSCGDQLPDQHRRPAVQQLAVVHPGDVRADGPVAALTAVFGMLALNGLPMPYHPVFNVPRFALATRDRFFLCIEARDPKFDLEATRAVPVRASGRARWRRCRNEDNSTRRQETRRQGEMGRG